MNFTRPIYWTYGWVWCRWWNLLTVRGSWWPWWRRIEQSLWSTRDALVNHPVRHFLVKAMRADAGCPHCRYDGWTDHDELFECVESGQYVNDCGTCHWWSGIQTCARCGTSHEYGDST